MQLHLSIVSAYLALVIVGPQTVHADPLEAVGVVKENGVRHVTAVEAAQLIESRPDIVVLDVRTEREFKAGHIETAQNINYISSKFNNHISALDPNATYLVHCKSGNRSGRAIPIMKNAGLENLIHMDGGFDAWKKAGLKLAK